MTDELESLLTQRDDVAPIYDTPSSTGLGNEPADPGGDEKDDS